MQPSLGQFNLKWRRELLSHSAKRCGGRTAAELVAVEKDNILGTTTGQVVSKCGPSDATANNYGIGLTNGSIAHQRPAEASSAAMRSRFSSAIRTAARRGG